MTLRRGSFSLEINVFAHFLLKKLNDIGKSFNLPFLVFLLTFTSGEIPLVLIGVVFIYMVNPVYVIPRKVSKVHLFYLLFLIYSVFGGLFYLSQFPTLDYFAKFLFGVFLWCLSLLSFTQINHVIKRTHKEKINSTLEIFFAIQVFVYVIQFISLIFQIGSVNPFIKNGAGDFLVGTFANSSINLVILFFYSVYFFFRKNIKRGLLAVLMMLSTTYMSGVLISIIAVSLFLFFSKRLALKFKIYVVLLSLVLGVVFFTFARSNVYYVKSNLELLFSLNPPRKIISFVETYNYVTTDWRTFLFGAGMGNFSSRLAFVSGGEYVEWYPKNLVHRANSFEENHFNLWNYKILSVPFSDGTANQPFSTYNRMIGEYGVLGMLLFIVFYFGYFVRNYKRYTFGKLLLVSMMGFWFLDYWFEYFSVMVFFETFLLLETFHNNKRQQ